MENLFIYMAKASGLLAVFFVAYYVFLRKETFFTSNRGFLLAGLVTSVLLPLAQYTRVIWVSAEPEINHETVQTLSAADVQQLILMQQMAEVQPEPFTINWWYVAGIIYLSGVFFFLSRFIIDFVSIRRILKGNKIVKEGSYKLIDSKKVKSPFSFFNYIVYNSATLKEQELESILSHEKVHSRQKHSADMIISQLFCIAFWFNPFVWLYKKSISQNLEFIADAVAIKQLTDRQAYQKTLLKITLQPECITITNHFYQSLIKKRIVMLNKKQSKRRNSWKYGIILPALAAFIMLFQVKVIAQEKAPEVNTASPEKTKISISIDKDATDKELAEQADIFKDEFDADITFSDITRNANGEITAIRVVVKGKDQSKVYQLSGNNPINTFSVEMEKEDGSGNASIVFGSPKTNSVIAETKNHTEKDTPIQKSGKLKTSSASSSHNEDCNIAYAYASSNGTSSANISPNGALVVVNGVKQPKNDDEQINLPKGQSVSSMNVLSAKEAKKKYGKEGKKGAIEITTKKGLNTTTFRGNSYTYDDDGNMVVAMSPLHPMPAMPPMDEIMSYAKMGAEEGMKAVASIDWENMKIPGLSEADRAEIREEMKRARVEVEKAFSDVKFNFDKQSQEYQEAYRDMSDEQKEKSMEKMQARLEKMQAKLESMQAKLEQKQKELTTKKANLNKKAK